MDEITRALPENLNQIIGAVVTLLIAIIGAFKGGKAVGTRSKHR